MFRRILLSISVVGLVWLVAAQSTRACPFCQADGKTLTQDMDGMDVVVLAQLEVPPPKVAADADPNSEIPKAKFRVLEVLKGQKLVNKGVLLETIYFGEAKKGAVFMINAVGPVNLQWTTPLALSERGQAYVKKLSGLPKVGPERLVFFQDYLEDSDELLARDAYDEFAKAPYSDVKGLKDQLNHEKIVDWVNNPKVSGYRRRLYFTMLGICGTERDIPMLEEMIRSDSREKKAGLDALVACYLSLKGDSGLPVVNDLFLKNEKSDYQETYSSIMALRFHLQEPGAIAKEQLLASLRYVLERPPLADLVIPDLAKHKDWSCMERLVTLFKTSDEKTSWVRVPVVNYLRLCPMPEAKGYLKELEKIDPESVRRANTYFPTPQTASDTPAKS